MSLPVRAAPEKLTETDKQAHLGGLRIRETNYNNPASSRSSNEYVLA